MLKSMNIHFTLTLRGIAITGPDQMEVQKRNCSDTQQVAKYRIGTSEIHRSGRASS